MRGNWLVRGTILKKLSHVHYAFFKATILGLDQRLMYERYIAAPEARPVDIKVIHGLRQWILEEFVRLAGRHDRTTGIRLLRIQPESLKISDVAVQSMEQFESEIGVGFYSEAELIDLFQAHHRNHPELRQNAKNARKRQRQLDLIAFLISQEQVEVGPDDLISAWLEPSITKYFTAAGETTIRHLVSGINAHGYHWYKRIPGIGAKVANHIVMWLTSDSVSQSLGMRLEKTALLSPTLVRQQDPQHLRSPETGIVPIEYFKPNQLDGSDRKALMTNRHPHPKTSAYNDKEAIEQWLKSVKPNSPTFRSYRKEAERFLLWAVLERKKPFSSLLAEDIVEYRNFLARIGRTTTEDWQRYYSIEMSRWLGARCYPRYSPLWRPFEGRLSDLSQKYALKVLSTLCEYLCRIKYLDSNPFTGLTYIRDVKNQIHVDHALTKSNMAVIRDYLAQRIEDQKYARIQMILYVAYSTGLRISEMVSLTRGHFNRFMRLDDKEMRWQVTVIGKGDKERKIPLPQEMMKFLETYFIKNGVTEGFEHCPPTTTLFSHLSRPNLALGHDRLYMLLKGFFGEIASFLQETDPDESRRFQKASTHWMRHTFANHMLESGGSLEVLRDLLGHASLNTTSIYISTQQDRRSKEIDKFMNTAPFLG